MSRPHNLSSCGIDQTCFHSDKDSCRTDGHVRLPALDFEVKDAPRELALRGQCGSLLGIFRRTAANRLFDLFRRADREPSLLELGARLCREAISNSHWL